MNGFLLIDKAGGMTSHDVVAMARKKLDTKKVGHAGTLDPMATGVLVLGVGIATRLLTYITDGKKTYEATISLGKSTHTDDKEGEVLSSHSINHITDDAIRSYLSSQVGIIMQVPSKVSAIKIAGERAYDLVRQGKEVEIPARQVEISKLEVIAISRNEFIDIDIDVTCSAGTFIRAIARDLGEELKVGGHLSALRRTRVAGFALDVATSIEDLKAKNFIALDLTEVARRTFDARELTVEEVRELSFGRPLSPSASDGIVAGVSGENELIALLKNESDKAKPVAVFAAAH